MSSPPLAQTSLAPGDPDSLASRLTVIAVASALFMQQVDSTVLSTALPALAHAFRVNPVNLKVALTSYIMAQAVFLPASGWMADRFGARRVFMWAMVVFLLGSMLCGLSRSLEQLVGARIIQGLGGAMMTPVGRIIVVGAFRREDLMRAMAWLTTPALIGPILGPPLSGFILGFADWPWIFYINLPVGLIGLLGVARFVPKGAQPHPGPFDRLGFFLSALVIGALMIGAEGIGLLPVGVQIAACVAAIAFSFAYLRHARRQPRPVLDLSLLRHHTLRASITGGLFFRLTLGATPFLMPLLLQAGLGWNALHAGIVTMFSAIGAVAVRPLLPRVVTWLGYRTTLTISALAGGLLAMSPVLFILPGWTGAAIVLLALGGLFRAAQLSSLNTIAFAEIPGEAVSRASTVTAVFQQVSISLGITLAGLLLRLSQILNNAEGMARLAPRVFVLPFVVIGVLTMAAAMVYRRLPANAGAALAGRSRA